MKKLLTYLFLFTLFLSLSCKEDKPKTIPGSNTSTKITKHYICANKCENSGSDTAGNCPVCKTPYTHNQAFHNDEFLKSGPIKVESNTPLPNANSPSTNSAAVEPAQNANGVYHYTCKNACYGGAGTATNCASCGEVLEHNAAYHN